VQVAEYLKADGLVQAARADRFVAAGLLVASGQEEVLTAGREVRREPAADPVIRQTGRGTRLVNDPQRRGTPERKSPGSGDSRSP
jgi:hypothetical protein